MYHARSRHAWARFLCRTVQLLVYFISLKFLLYMISAGFGLTLTKPEGTQGIFILHAPIDSHVQHYAFDIAVWHHCWGAPE